MKLAQDRLLYLQKPQTDMQYLKTFILLFLIAAFSSSCIVSKKRFDELLAEKVSLDADMAQLEKKLTQLEKEAANMSNDLNASQEEKDALKNELAVTDSTLTSLQAAHDKLKVYYNNALSNSGKLNRDLAEQQEHLLALQETLNQAKIDNNQLSDSLAIRERKVAELEQVLEQSQGAIQDLKDKVNKALLGFGESELTVEERDGKIYVSLSEQLLFKSGSAVIDAKGKSALVKLASALKDSPEINVVVEGHTDNVRISRPSKYMIDNWDLSVIRATSMVRILVNSGVNASSLTAAGKGQHSPLAKNDSAANKQKNRRTDIILTPDLSKLFEILNYDN